MLVHERVAQTLADLGVRQAFGVVGSGNYAVTRGLVERGVRYAAARHEGGAAAMADAYAQLSGSVPVLTVHQGCGLTNAVTGIGEAAKSGTPMVVLAAEVPAAARRSAFRIAQDRLVESVGAVSLRVTAGSAVRDVVLAYRTAVTRRVPVLLNLPLDVQDAVGGDGEVPVPRPPLAPAPARPDVDALAGLLAGARRPVLVAGRGARA
ncbi:thiamine pyrophosphate-binding protein, partial [Streptomyces sp. B1866]|uniref:thiamine pyrophosphate-binding protein n=1 Tax=Streptomyces sp. B1866 TaxID=3075431 RepID=UPI00288FE820